MGVRGTTSSGSQVRIATADACRHATQEQCILATTVESTDDATLRSMLQEQSYNGEKVECLNYALQIAALEGRLSLAALLVTRGADINFEGGLYETALGAAIFGGHQDMVEWLLQRGAEVDTESPMFCTPLHAAALCGRSGVVLELLKYGADVNRPAGMYKTALQVASLEGNKAVVEVLLIRGADVDIQGGIHGNALAAAAAAVGLHVPSGFPLAEADIDLWLHQNKMFLQTTRFASHSAVILILLEALRIARSKGHSIQPARGGIRLGN
jgi:ankyrin repeat protein